MRNVTDHQLPGLNEKIEIAVLDKPTHGGASHLYQLTWGPMIRDSLVIHFQEGPIKEAGVNGVSQEALVAVVIDRMRSFQAGEYACGENQMALVYLEKALECLQSRTKARLARGVEGTHQK